MKKAIPYIITIVIVAFAIWLIFSPSKVAGIPKESILFFGDGCPHCKIVDDFIVANNVDKKLTFSKKEVWHNQDNLILMTKIWNQCGLNNQDGMTVPLYWDGINCYKGQEEIINFFKTKI
ncbi:MAG: hypothetical protein WCT11_00265 [Candidatus Magasanikbacteria bacterium]|jgi:hypothetical protein